MTFVTPDAGGPPAGGERRGWGRVNRHGFLAYWTGMVLVYWTSMVGRVVRDARF